MSRILISGASGLIGLELVSALKASGNEVVRLVRRPAKARNERQWDPMREVPPDIVSGVDAVIHLSGENVAGLWTREKKRRIRESRVVSTGNLSCALTKAPSPPHTFICASAIGYYGDRGDETLTEESTSGTGFLPEVCREWEAATVLAAKAGIRVINLRLGIVLSAAGGALQQMLWPFRLGLGGKIGSGRQWWSWIQIDDVIGAVEFMLRQNSNVGQRASSPVRNFSGPVNLVSPNPVTNAEFTRALATMLRRPAVLTAPRFALKLVLRKFADEGVLASARVMPKKLIESGFEFRYPEITGALRDVL